MYAIRSYYVRQQLAFHSLATRAAFNSLKYLAITPMWRSLLGGISRSVSHIPHGHRANSMDITHKRFSAIQLKEIDTWIINCHGVVETQVGTELMVSPAITNLKGVAGEVPAPIVRLQVSVITSYSIHYTKLYDIPLIPSLYELVTMYDCFVPVLAKIC